MSSATDLVLPINSETNLLQRTSAKRVSKRCHISGHRIIKLGLSAMVLAGGIITFYIWPGGPGVQSLNVTGPTEASCDLPINGNPCPTATSTAWRNTIGILCTTYGGLSTFYHIMGVAWDCAKRKKTRAPSSDLEDPNKE